MPLPFGITIGQITVVGVLTGIVGFGVSKLWDWWRSRVEARRERVYQWHRDMQEMFSMAISVGRRTKVKQRTGVRLDEVEELVPVASTLDAKVNTPPSGVKRLVDGQVFRDVRKAAGLVYHLVRLPAPEEDPDSIAGVMRHQYGLLQGLDMETDVEMLEVLDVIGEVAQPEEIDISATEAERVLTRFEGTADGGGGGDDRSCTDEAAMGEVDRVVSAEARRELVEFSVKQYYEKALLEIPRNARSVLSDSQDELFE